MSERWEPVEHFHHFLFVFVYDLNLFFFFFGFLIIAPQSRRCHFVRMSSRGPPAIVPSKWFTCSTTHLAGCDPLRQSPTATLPFSPSVQRCYWHFQAPFHSFKKGSGFFFFFLIYSVPLYQKTNISPLCPIQNATPLSNQGAPFKIKCIFRHLPLRYWIMNSFFFLFV